MKLSLASLATTVLLGGTRQAVAHMDEICQSTSSYSYDSGYVATASANVTIATAPWIQLDLSESRLAPDAKLLLIGTKDTQELTAASLKDNGHSAVFLGESVTVELLHAGEFGTGSLRGSGSAAEVSDGPQSRVIVSAVTAGLCDLGTASICGRDDDRTRSTDDRQGRIGGCTGWLVSPDVFVWAGHCGTPKSSDRMHFTRYYSAQAKHQYAFDIPSYRGVNNGVGKDWGAGRLLPNSSTGKLPGIAQSERCGSEGCGWYQLRSSIPSRGSTVRVTGYGVANWASQEQKTHTSALVDIGNRYISYTPDTTGGNSGSPVIHEASGRVIGVHTHGGCTETGGYNQGTRIDQSDFKSYLEFLTKTCAQHDDCGDGNCPGKYGTCVTGKCLCTNDPPPPPPSPTPPAPAPAACPSGQVPLDVKVVTDNYPQETTWVLKDMCSGATIEDVGPYDLKGNEYFHPLCVSPSRYEFLIVDEWSDGICCNYGRGSYTVHYNGSQKKSGGSFGASESTVFGPICSSGQPINAVFDADFGAPKCSSVGMSCRTQLQGLLDGRGNDEPNRPNAIGASCADGTSGTYHEDESIDAIAVSAKQGTKLQAGQVAKLQVKAWAYKTGSYDTAHFYYAEDADSIDWKYIGSKPAGGEGLRTLEVEYRLSSKATQAVRVTFCYNQASASSCCGGNWDDVDSLVFTVSTESAEGVAYDLEPEPVPEVGPLESTDCSTVDDKHRCKELPVCKWHGKECQAKAEGMKHNKKSSSANNAEDAATEIELEPLPESAPLESADCASVSNRHDCHVLDACKWHKKDGICQDKTRR